MRGSPLIHSVLAVIAFALFAVPLSRLTFARPDANPVERTSVTSSAPEKQTFVRIRFAHVPKSLSLKLGDKELVPAVSTEPTAFIEASVQITIPKEGLELAVAAQWPEGTPDTAVTVELEPDELDARRETTWSNGSSLTGILFFKW